MHQVEVLAIHERLRLPTNAATDCVGHGRDFTTTHRLLVGERRSFQRSL
jgi:hypothetical protein